MYRYLIIYFSFVFSLSLFAASYTITGNTKTKTHYIEKLIRDCEKQSKTNPAELEQCLLNARIFSEVKVEKEDENVLVKLKDRWSIIPVPSLKVNNDGKRSVGMFLIDGNFLGTGTLFGVGGAYATNSSSYVVFYRNESFLYSDWTISINIGKDNADIYWKNMNLKEIDAFREKTAFSSWSLGYSYTPNLHFEGSYIRRFVTYDSLDHYNAPQEFHSNIITLEGWYKNESYKFYFSEGYKIAAAVDQEFWRTDKAPGVNLVRININQGFEMPRQQALQTTYNLSCLTGGDKRDALKSGRRYSKGKGLRGIPEGGYFTDVVATMSADYQFPVHFTKYGVWTVAPFGDFGRINDYLSRNEDLWQKAYGIGTYFFLTDIMIPGVGLVAGRNETFNNNFIEFTVGESF